jgi:hypothetical protein
MTTGYKPDAGASILGSERDIKLHNWSIGHCGNDDADALMSCVDTKMNELLIIASNDVRSKIASGELAPYGSLTTEEMLNVDRDNEPACFLWEDYVRQHIGAVFDADSDLFNAAPISVNDVPIELPLP